MNRKWIGAALGALLVSVMALPEAAAEFSIKMGTRWEPIRYTFAVRSVCPAASAMPGCGGAETGLDVFQNVDLNPYIGVGFTDRISLNIGLDFATASYGLSIPRGTIPVDSASYFQFGLKVAMKFYLSVPKRDQIAAYLWVDFFKYFASVHDVSRTVLDPADRYAASLMSPLGGSLGFGLEYFFNKYFSIGAEIIGLRLSYTSAYDGSLNGVGFLNCAPGTCSANNTTFERHLYLSMYTLFTMNFHIFGLLEIRAKVYSKDDDGSTDVKKTPPPKKPEPDEDDDDDADVPDEDADDEDE